ncbi:hypothetical protein RRG08_056733 [Elysia crispata]|uniref:Uncharacterized protein n=1 Tax=Elysia crispata TaxID=231223 RepID=A0AAE0YWT2_9GAST|nr:hypothetical protein RRG08_056733 [Elysia crispata]
MEWEEWGGLVEDDMGWEEWELAKETMAWAKGRWGWEGYPAPTPTLREQSSVRESVLWDERRDGTYPRYPGGGTLGQKEAVGDRVREQNRGADPQQPGAQRKGMKGVGRVQDFARSNRGRETEHPSWLICSCST